MERIRKTSLSVVFVVVAVFLIYASLQIELKGADYVVSPRAVPLGLSLTMAVLAAWILALDWLRGEPRGKRLTLRGVGAMAGFLAIVLGYVLMMGVVNFHVLTFLFLVVAFYFFGVRSPVRMLGTAGGLVAAEYLIFEYGFLVVFP